MFGIFGILADASSHGGNILLPKGASTIAAEIDWLTWFITWVSIIFGGAVAIVTVLLAWRFRHKPGINDKGKGATHSTLLEITWSVIPGIIVLLIAIWGFQGYMRFSVMPPNALEIQVEGQKWSWTFTYPNGHTEPTLHIPKGVPVRFVMTSKDVIHSLYFPNFRIKKDVVPGRYTKLWVIATETSPLKEGKSWEDPNSFDYDVDKPETHYDGFDVFCTEYCGTRHSKMLTKVYVHPDYKSYKAWLDLASDPFRNGADGQPPKTTEVGFKLAKNNGCFQCHSADGTKNIGPTWKDMFGHQGTFANGGEPYTADETYIRESIDYPNKHIVAGYNAAMPSYLGKFKPREMTALINYMKSISKNYQGQPAELDAPVPVPPPLPAVK